VRDRLGPIVDHVDVGEIHPLGHVPKKVRLLAGGLQEREVNLGQYDRQRHARQATPRAHVDHVRRFGRHHVRQQGQAVEDVFHPGLVRVGDGGEIEPRVGLEQQRQELAELVQVAGIELDAVGFGSLCKARRWLPSAHPYDSSPPNSNASRAR